MNILNRKNGLAALPLVLMLGGLITAITVSLLMANLLSTQSEFGLRLNSQAFAASQSGIQDALMRIVRDKTFAGSYSINFTDGSSVDVIVCRDAIAPVCVGLGKDKVTALGKSQGRNRKFEVIAGVDSTTGEMSVESINEIAL